MGEAGAIELGRQALMTGMVVSAPMLLAGLVVGVAISVVLAATQIQEFTLTFIPKLIAMAAAAAFCAPWMLNLLVTYTQHVMQKLSTVGP